ncbi:DUF2142 domain-containing protein [Clostridium butyricum]|uniref:DUF2142 domain-containing protein n=1 Tax=Clostridium butyricum TaxID=1492 RepID=UPI0018ABE61E|nr:DUF2142 domain-containing protein [Clostridium butyricum]
MNIIKEKLHYYFLNISIVLGVILVIFGPPLTVPDENTHFLNSYTISDGQIFVKNIDGKIGKYIPESIFNFATDNNSKFTGINGQKYSFNEYYFNSHLEQNNEETIFKEYWCQDINPVSYIFSATGMFVGKLLLPEKYESPFNFLLFGRIFNLIFYISIIYVAIKISPYYKNTIFLLSIMPMSMYLGASLSYDAILIPSMFLLFAYILRLRALDKIVLKDIIIICSILFILFSIKQAYAPFALVLFAIPYKNFGDKNRYYKIIFLAFGICILALGISQINNIISLSASKDINNNIILQKQYLKENFGLMIPIIINTFLKYKQFYISGFIGILGQLDTNLPIPILVISLIIIILVVAIDSCEAIDIKVDFKIFGILALFIFIYFSFRSMYINWTPLVEDVYGNTASGIQGRYFIPASPFIFAILSNKLFIKHKLINKLVKYNTNIVYFTGITFSYITGLTILLRYWG